METNELTAGLEEAEVKKRGFWLTAFLILAFIANPVTAFAYFFNPELIVDLYPKSSVVLVYMLGIMCIVNFVLAIGIWNWKNWGILGFYAVAATAFFVNLYIGLGIGGSLGGLVGIVWLVLATRKKWTLFSS